ncbi:hypothetical protein SAMN05518672_101123 [Chitinophaga sp. CF118]|uniref:hypothetical protein n=1 Tax=Chitinophaga sp. CF118 TaxID=1884367 RepID=UPI0008F2C55E|nr:hypothetical protein [Chitinophaga sp. CF118]SFD03069.1 hypothetical protein SAMN05518672_101123 [Chitinophaga sp. CF118]
MKSFLFLPLLVLGVLFSSCRKEEIIQQVVVPNRTITTTVNPSDWKLDTDKNTYYVTISMPEIDGRVYNTNGVLVYISFDGIVYEAIPDVLFGSTFEVTHSIGSISIDSQNADGSLPANHPTAAITVKIVLVDSDPV